jgi:hypothetical protein
LSGRTTLNERTRAFAVRTVYDGPMATGSVARPPLQTRIHDKGEVLMQRACMGEDRPTTDMFGEVNTAY